MLSCYKHRELESVTTCATCSKNYCEECLVLIGKLKVACCKDCYSEIKKLTKKSILRKRILYILTGVITFIFFLAYLVMPELINNLSIYLILLSGFVVFNIIRVRQLKENYIAEEYL